MRAAIVGDPRRSDTAVATKGGGSADMSSRMSAAMAQTPRPSNATRPRQRCRRGLSSETRGVDAARYCFLVSEGFSVVLVVSVLTAAPLPASVLVAAAGATGAAAFGAT